MTRLNTSISSITKLSYGHWKVVVVKRNYNRECMLNSITEWIVCLLMIIITERVMQR
jgi:hypothetical protein